MSVTQQDPGFEHGRAAMAYLTAKVTGDDETAGLLRATGDAWLMLDWMTAALAGWLARLHRDQPAGFRRAGDHRDGQ